MSIYKFMVGNSHVKHSRKLDHTIPYIYGFGGMNSLSEFDAHLAKE
jgi:hypothetical protein